ncbi:unnamed protein product [Lepeophtheirus salmonis]|uniref:(salmon louse) hypothetical protein n=1 Tax=Lepeophtheirus salmonis TaxID=72036 RepID=A0A7R8CQR3_LEPSM|nr:unnamed protein product [Lepeophtheirus salmonis]CAF2898271.1 unnamed protein product [Lepeophtheirus salmonis]
MVSNTGAYSNLLEEREEVVEHLLQNTPELRPRNLVKNNSFDMRKYYKLILVAVTLISLLFFIFYKTQYDKLYNVLQVLEFYGTNKESGALTPNASDPSCPKLNLFLEDYNRRESDPLPTWKSLNDNLWIYSAYCPEAHCSMAMALALAKEEAISIQELHCQLWHAQSATGVEGILAVEKSQSISFYTKSNSVFLQIGGADEEPLSESISLCLAPQKDHHDSTYVMLENVIWHHIFGVNNFYIYDGGSSKKFFTNVNSIALNLIKMDCHLRSIKKFQTFTLLELHQILVPKSTKSLVDEFESFIPKDSKHLKVPLLRFCAEYPEKNEDIAVTALSINMYYAPLSSSISLAHRYASNHINTSKAPNDKDDGLKEISKNIFSVHDYSPCNKFDIDLNSPETVKDNTIATKFKSEFKRKYNNLFPHKDL